MTDEQKQELFGAVLMVCELVPSESLRGAAAIAADISAMLSSDVSRANLLEVYDRIGEFSDLCLGDEDLENVVEDHLHAIDKIIADALGVTPYDLIDLAA